MIVCLINILLNKEKKRADADISATMDDTTSIEQQQARLHKRLEQLTIEHRDLDEVIEETARSPAADLVRLQRLKKRKLSIKDEIRSIHQRLLPDIIA